MFVFPHFCVITVVNVVLVFGTGRLPCIGGAVCMAADQAIGRASSCGYTRSGEAYTTNPQGRGLRTRGGLCMDGPIDRSFVWFDGRLIGLLVG